MTDGWTAVAKKVTTQKEGRIETVWYVRDYELALSLLDRIPEG